LSRCIIVGSSCSGKSTLARKLSLRLGLTHLELDEFYWLEGWQPRKEDDFRSLVIEGLPDDKWIIDGNYSVIRQDIWPRATTLIWLNLPLRTVFWRGFVRGIGRGFTGDRACGGNKESLYRTFCSRDSILLWILSTYHRRRRDIENAFESDDYPNLRFIQLNSRLECDNFIENLGQCDITLGSS